MADGSELSGDALAMLRAFVDLADRSPGRRVYRRHAIAEAGLARAVGERATEELRSAGFVDRINLGGEFLVTPRGSQALAPPPAAASAAGEVSIGSIHIFESDVSIGDRSGANQSEPKPWRQGLLITLVVGVIASVIAAAIWDSVHNADSTATASFGIPVAGASVSVSGGVRASGPVDGLDTSDALWLLDRDHGELTIAEKALIVGHVWSATSSPLGDEGEATPFEMSLVLVHATGTCSRTLERREASGDESFSSIPDGCTALDEVPVVVDRP